MQPQLMQFMLTTSVVRPEWRIRLPAVTHSDGSSRPQLLRTTDESPLAILLDRFHQLSGLPCIVNTSLNTNGLPIADSPNDAIQIFEGLDTPASLYLEGLYATTGVVGEPRPMTAIQHRLVHGSGETKRIEPIQGIIVHRIRVSAHCGKPDTADDVLRFFTNTEEGAAITGGTVPYSLVIERSGAAIQFARLGTVTPHAALLNERMIGVACVGDFREELVLRPQWEMLVAVCGSIREMLSAQCSVYFSA